MSELGGFTGRPRARGTRIQRPVTAMVTSAVLAGFLATAITNQTGLVNFDLNNRLSDDLRKQHEQIEFEAYLADSPLSC